MQSDTTTRTDEEFDLHAEVAASRRRQGLSEKVADPEVIAAVVALLLEDRESLSGPADKGSARS